MFAGLVALVSVMSTGPVSDAATVDSLNQEVLTNNVANTGIEPRAAVTTLYSVINKKTVNKNYVNYGQRIGDCSVGKGGGTCQISVTNSSTRTVGLSLGVSRKSVTTALDISNATTVANSTTCTSNRLKAGQSWKAYPKGTRYSYQVQKLTFVGGQVNKKETSGTLYAFDPKPNSIHCTQ